LRLGALIGQSRRSEALEAYRALLGWVPSHPKALEALISLLDPVQDAQERADVLERLVSICSEAAGEDAGAKNRAVDLALELGRAREQLEDLTGRERALDLAARINSEHAQVPGELRRLADALQASALAQSDTEKTVEMLQKAAAIYWNRLDDTDGAARLLYEAHTRDQDNAELIGKLVRCLIESDRGDDAIDMVTDALERHPEGDAHRIRLLRHRVAIRVTSGDHTGAVDDLEEALTLGAENIEPQLRDALEHARDVAQGAGDGDAERRMTMRLAEILRLMGKEEEAQEEIATWVNRNPTDREAIHVLLEADVAKERWDDAAVSYARLLKLEDGQAKIDVALGLADAYEKTGRPGAGREALEDLYKKNQSNRQLRSRLRKVYEQSDAHRELANLLLVEANDASDDDQRFDLLREAGRIRVELGGQAATAIGPLMEALDIRPKDHLTTLLLADAYIAAGFTDDAVALLDSAMERHGNRKSKDLAALQHRMARAMAEKNPDAAVNWLMNAWESHPQSGELASELAEKAMRLEKYDIALKALRALAAMRTPAPISRPMALLKQAEISRLQGDDRKAAFLAKKALGEDAEFAEAKDFLAEIGDQE
jgi:predicted Zn-dependent protease